MTPLRRYSATHRASGYSGGGAGEDMTEDTPLRCRFCDKSQSQVAKLILASGIDIRGERRPEISICNECVALCMTVLAYENRDWFDKAVEDARDFIPEPPENSN